METSVKTETKISEALKEMRAKARALLDSVLGFRDCPAAVLDELAEQGELRHIAKGEFIQHQGDPTTHVIMVVTGLLEGSLVRQEGQRHLFGLVPPGGFAGLMAVVDGRPVTHGLSAREPSVLMMFPLEFLHALRLREPSLVLACERQIVSRARLVTERLSVDPGVHLEARVASMLCMLAGLHGQREEQGITFAVKFSQMDLADWLGLSRQRVNFALKQLESDRLVRLEYSKLTILDPEGLHQRARG